MLRKVKHTFIPYEGNNFYPRFKKPKALGIILLLLLGIQVFLNFTVSTTPKVLGFATDIHVQDVINLSNKERENQGLPALKTSSVLCEAARQKAEYMFEHDFWAHVAPDGTTPWDFFASVGYDFYFAGENLARDFNTSAGVVRGWMNSPSHRENILNNDFEEIGIAVVNGELDGEETTLVVQMFGTPLSAGVAEKTEQTGSDQQQAVQQVAADAKQVESQPTYTAYGLESEITTEQASRPKGSSFSLAKPSLDSLYDLGPTGQVYIPFLTVLMLLFVIDSYVLLRKKKVRLSGHSMLHAVGIGLSMAAMMLLETGQVL